MSTKQASARAIARFDPFKSAVAHEPLSAKVAWVFKPRVLLRIIEFELGVTNSIAVIRATRGPGHVANVFDETGTSLIGIEHCEKGTFTKPEGRHVTMYFGTNNPLKRVEVEEYGKNSSGTCVAEYSSMKYEGQCLVEYNATRKINVTIHGDGKWIFSNGDVLEGEGVAWKGQPRWPRAPQPKQKKQKR